MLYFYCVSQDALDISSGDFTSWVSRPNAEDDVPSMWDEDEQAFPDQKRKLYGLMLIQAFRPDR